MNDNNHREDPSAAELGIWENEGGAPDRHATGRYHGRRMEPDKSWTIHHVFSGAPAELQGWSMAGPGETEASSTMIFLNTRNTKRRQESGFRQTFATRF